MPNFDKKEQETLKKIVTTINKLDKYLDEIADTPDDKKDIKKWYAQKRAVHEIKRLLHEINQYDTYDDEELTKTDDNFENLGLDDETVAYITNYF